MKKISVLMAILASLLILSGITVSESAAVAAKANSIQQSMRTPRQIRFLTVLHHCSQGKVKINGKCRTSRTPRPPRA